MELSSCLLKVTGCLLDSMENRCRDNLFFVENSCESLMNILIGSIGVLLTSTEGFAKMEINYGDCQFRHAERKGTAECSLSNFDIQRRFTMDKAARIRKAFADGGRRHQDGAQLRSEKF